MNWTLPGRLHLMIHRDWFWITLYIFGRRFHWSDAVLVEDGYCDPILASDLRKENDADYVERLKKQRHKAARTRR